MLKDVVEGRIVNYGFASRRRFLCFGGFSRLSGIIRAGGGVPVAIRARRRASLEAENRFLRVRAMFSEVQSERSYPVKQADRRPGRRALFAIRFRKKSHQPQE